MEWVKTTAKTLPEAIDLALDNLGVDEAEAEIVVIEEPRQGLFGRTRGTARVEARVKPKPVPPKQERNRNKRNRSDGGGRNRNDRNKNRSKNRSGGDGGGNDNRSDNRNDNRNKNRKSGNNSGGGGNGGGGGKGRGGQKDDRAKSGGGTRSDKNSGGNNRSADQEGRQGRSKARGNGNDQNMKPKEESPVEDVAEHLETFLTGLTEAFGFDDGVTIDRSEEDILVGQVVGQHGLLVGPKGRTLDAIQELARISCQRAVPSSVRIKVDVGGYRQKRVEALGQFARKAAEAAVADQVEVALEPMSPADRKAVHDALGEDDRVETRSVGSEPRRKVLVVPVVGSDTPDDDPADTPTDDTADDDVAAAADNNGDSPTDQVADQADQADEVSEDVVADQASGDGSEEE